MASSSNTASGVGLGIVIDDSAVKAMLKQAPQKVIDKIRQLVEGNAIDVQREMMIEAPVGVTGNLRGGVKYTMQIGDTISAEILPPADYAAAVEYGSRPHWVSVKVGTSLYDWATRKNISPYALQYSIAQVGTRPHPFVKPTFDKMQPRVLLDINSGMAQLVEDFNNGTV